MRNNHLAKALIYFTLLAAMGALGYSFLLQLNLLDALLLTVRILSTIGYTEVAVMSTEGKLLSIMLMFGGIALVGYIFISTVNSIAGGHIQDSWRLRQMDNRIEALKNHYIICGAGETGQNVAAQFELSGDTFVIIDNREDIIKELRKKGYLVIHGEPTQEAALKQAQISKAKGLISALTTDADNIYVVLTARYLNKDIYIVSRAIEPHAQEKLSMAGANRTVSPNAIGGRRMAAMMTKPSIFSFLDIVTYTGEEAYSLEEISIPANSQLAGLKLRESNILEKTGLIVLSLKKNSTGKMLFNPGPDEVLEINDSMIVIGKSDQVKSLSNIADIEPKK